MMSNASISIDQQTSNGRPIELFLDILIVFAMSALALFVEILANDQGWISVREDASGVSAVLGGALAAVAIVLARGGTLADLGFKRPKRWAMVPIQVVAILVVFVAVQNLAPMLVSSFMTVPEPDLSRHNAIAGDLGAAIALALILPLTASIPEEIIYRGFLIGRLSDLFSRKIGGGALAVFVQALIFGAVHYQWGAGGMLVTVIMGIVWGSAYLLCDRNLWVVILAHSVGHIFFVIQLYMATSIIL